MIRLEQSNNLKDDYYSIYVDRDLISESWAYKTVSQPDAPFQYLVNKRSFWIISTQTIEDFEPFSAITINNIYSWLENRHSIIISQDLNEDTKEEVIVFTFYFSPNLTYWNERYSFAEYFKVFEKECNDKFEEYFEIVFEETSALRLELYFKKSIFPIGAFLNPIEKEIQIIHDETIKKLQNKYQDNLVKSLFEFPEQIKVPCEQYLLYFAQFLQDLGVNATLNLREEAGKVLFSVTPTDDVEALDKIREALAIYLHLPSSPIIYDESFASMRQKQQIENLQHSQRMIEMEFRLSQKVIASQDKMILQKDSLIEQQNKIIEKISSKSIMLDSVENKEELEEIYDGLKIGESKNLKEWLGIHLNPAKVIKTSVKNAFGKEETKSILGLDEETNRENN